MADPRGEMQASPRNALMGYLADALGGVNNYAQRKDPRMPGGLANPVLGMLSNALSVPSLATTADRMSYGAPLTNARQANVPWLKPETADALMMAPVSPRNALAAASLGMGMADNGAMRAATVWHGTPHKFDKFDASKIGTGEGAQAYGHGLYLAEHPATAQQYADNVKDMGAVKDINARLSQLSAEMDQYRGAEYGKFKDPRGYELKAQYDALMDSRSGVTQAPGNLYKVDLPDDQIAKMLDWDKPLSQQPANVQQAIGKYAQDQGMTGQQAYRAAHESFIRAGKAQPAAEKERQAVEALRRAGIPGIRYLDGGSRGAGQGSSNFVVFPGNEGLLSILERNGQPLR